MLKTALLTTAGLSCLLIAGAAQADEAQGTLNISATVVASCTITADAVAFGSINNLTALQIARGAVTTSCNVPVNPAPLVNFGAGNNFANNSRSMIKSGGTTLLAYELYFDAGIGYGFTKTRTDQSFVTTNGFEKSQSGLVEIRIPANQSVLPGSYSDVVTVTLTY